MDVRYILKEYPMTLGIFILGLIIVVAGAILTITNPDTLSFNEYLDALKNFAIAVGILGAGKAVKNGVAGHATPAFDIKPPPEAPEDYIPKDGFEDEAGDFPEETYFEENPEAEVDQFTGDPAEEREVFDQERVTQEGDAVPEGDVTKFGKEDH